MNILYVVPSYNRADGVSTLNYLSKAKIYVSPQDYDNYCKYNPNWVDRIVKVPDGVQGKGKAHVMNWLLDNLWTDDVDGIMIIDDDVSTLMAHSINGTKEDYKVDEELFYQLCEDFTLLAREWGCGMWSFGLNSDRFSYIPYSPFKTHSYLDGGLQGFCKKDDIRYDERLTVKEDVDMFLQQLKKYHKALRCDKYYWNKKSFEGQGGSQAFRSSKSEKEQFQLMQKKWGSGIIRPNKPKAIKKGTIRSIGGAIKLNIPLEGI